MNISLNKPFEAPDRDETYCPPPASSNFACPAERTRMTSKNPTNIQNFVN